MKENNKSQRSSSTKGNKNKKVDYNDYLYLKNSYIEMGEKYKKLKEENLSNLSMLKEYESQINEFQQTKENILKMFQEIQNYKTLKENNNQQYVQKISELETEINTKNLQIEKLTNIVLAYQENEKKFNDILKEKECEINQEKNQEKLLIIKEFNAVKDKFNNEKNSLTEQIQQKDEEIKNKEEEIKNKEEEIKNKDVELKNKENELQNKDNELQNKDNELKNKDSELQNKENEILQLKQMIQNLQQNIEKNEENNKNNEQIIKTWGEENFIFEQKNSFEIISQGSEIKNKVYELQEQKNDFMIERICSTNESSNNPVLKNENNLMNKINVNNNTNNNNTNNNKINNNVNSNIIDSILDNYLNSVNVGFTGSNKEKEKDDLESDDSVINNTELECEPIPSFILCVKKIGNKLNT